MSGNDNETRGAASSTILFFSLLQQAAGGEKQVDWPIAPPGVPIAELLGDLYARWPELSAWDGQIRVAVDLEYVDRDYIVKPGQEIALMPPVQGG
ncbi:MAG: MoaD/ThiS family protein [Verrucomicrobia bacterium]|nr:MoaD/ThiS family protein [Verrucomicrobiota bacterium]